MYRSGIFATDKQIQAMKAAQAVPYIVGVGGIPPRSPERVAHSCALEAGLPDIPGYYGCVLATGEFVSRYPPKPEGSSE